MCVSLSVFTMNTTGVPCIYTYNTTVLNQMLTNRHYTNTHILASTHLSTHLYEYRKNKTKKREQKQYHNHGLWLDLIKFSRAVSPQHTKGEAKYQTSAILVSAGPTTLNNEPRKTKSAPPLQLICSALLHTGSRRGRRQPTSEVLRPGPRENGLKREIWRNVSRFEPEEEACDGC